MTQSRLASGDSLAVELPLAAPGPATRLREVLR